MKYPHHVPLLELDRQLGSCGDGNCGWSVDWFVYYLQSQKSDQSSSWSWAELSFTTSWSQAIFNSIDGQSMLEDLSKP